MKKEDCGFYLISKSGISSIGMAMLSLLYFSCGGGGGGAGGDVTVSSPASQNSQGITECYECHADGLIQEYSGQQIFSSWLNGPHGGSNICMSCHSGRVSGQEIKDMDYATEISVKNFGSFNSHYLAAGGILIRTIGYEFDGQDYSNVIAYAHGQIGTTGDPDMGSNGPCVGCHMKTANGHKFINVTKNSGLVTDITTYTSVCSKCHASKATLITTLNDLDTGYDAALDEIVTPLEAQGIYYGSSYPCFFNVASPQIFPNAYTAWSDKDTLGAAFNLNLLKHLPGAYAHNYEYTKRLIYNSIDYLDDGNLNQSVGTTLTPGSALTFLGGGPRP